MSIAWDALMFVAYGLILLIVLALGITTVDHFTAPKPVLVMSRDSVVAREARAAGVPPLLAIAVSHVENTSGDTAAVSSAGAVGVMQVLPKFWQHQFEDQCGCGSLLSMRRNACVGVHVLKLKLVERKTTREALCAYHGSLGLPSACRVYSDSVFNKLVALGAGSDSLAQNLRQR